MGSEPCIGRLSPALEWRIQRDPSLDMDTFILPSPYVGDPHLEKDYEHSYVWEEEGEILGYILVYSNPGRTKHHLYKQVTSPFGRGKGIGSAFLYRLAQEADPNATVYVYVWEKLTETLGFFLNKGFVREGQIVYRNLVYIHLAVRAGSLAPPADEAPARTADEDLGRTRHDARKTVRLLSDMLEHLSVENCNRIIEDINRETTALINLLNAYRSSVQHQHDVDLKELIFERIIPYVELSRVPCEVRVSLAPRTGAAYTHYLDVGRALVNLISNSLDAIQEAGRPGVIQLSLAERSGMVELVVADNGVGMEPEMLEPGADGLPSFVGRSTKGPSVASRARGGQQAEGPREPEGPVGDQKVGEGQGMRQVYAAFGAENIRVESERGKFTRWTIRIPKRSQRDNSALRSLEERYRRYHELAVFPDLAREVDPARIASFIWQTTSLEILCWDLIVPFGLRNNIREIYRSVLAYWNAPGGTDRGFETLQVELAGYRVEAPEVREWLVDTARMFKRNTLDIARHVPYEKAAGHIFRSYGQSVGKTVIFTMDPSTGRFLAADRKLAEHVDFAPYLGKRREELLRGELTGDIRNTASPIRLGVWSITGRAHAIEGLRFLRQGCARLLHKGVPPEKKLAFYPTTYRAGPVDLDIYRLTSLGEFRDAPDDRLATWLMEADEEPFFSGTAD